MLLFIFSTFLVLSFTPDVSFADSHKLLLQDVCFDMEGHLKTGAGSSYPVTLHSAKQDNFWEMKFITPPSVYAYVYDIHMLASVASNYTITIRRHTVLEQPQVLNLSVKGQEKVSVNVGNVSNIRIENRRGNFKLEDFKVSAILSPARCLRPESIAPIAGGCYSVHELSSSYDIRYKCDRGFRLDNVLPKTTFNCEKKHKDIPKCKKELAPCQPLDEPINGGKKGNNYRDGRKVSFFCFPGYNLVGHDSVRCVNGSWNPPSNVVCKAKECPKISTDAVTNGKVYLKEVSQSGYTYGNFLKVKCNTGFLINGKDIINCRENGAWDSNLPSCTAKSKACSEVNCGKGKECQITENGLSRCVCSASLQHNCLSDIKPVCTSNNLTFWSQCQMFNYSCHNPNEHFAIVSFRPCAENQLSSVEVSTNGGAEKKMIYKCSYPKKAGPCKAHFTRYYFDQEQNRCLQFGWGGCQENANNFLTLEDCERACKDFKDCQRNQRFESDQETNLALNRRVVGPSKLASLAFVDNSRIFNEKILETVRVSSWKVSLKAPSVVTKVILWNSDQTIPWLNISLLSETKTIASKYFDQRGRCRYVWTIQINKSVSAVGVETTPAASLLVDEIEVIGKYDRGTLINLTAESGSASQHPSTSVSPYSVVTSADKAINGRLENDSAAANFANCASTLSILQRQHWFQIDLKRQYFITEIALWLPSDRLQRERQTGLTVFVSNTTASSSRVSPEVRCGGLYRRPANKNPVFPCYFEYATRYVIVKKSGHGIQLCEVQVFAAKCDTLPVIRNAKPLAAGDFFAPKKVEYRCNNGFAADRPIEVSCGRLTHWAPVAEGKQLCKKAQDTGNGNIQFSIPGNHSSYNG
jgi:hypothetical protein